MSETSGLSPQENKRKRYNTESGVLDHVLMIPGPMAQEAGRDDEGAVVYGNDVYDDDDDRSEEEKEMEERPVKKRKGPPRFSMPRAGL